MQLIFQHLKHNVIASKEIILTTFNIRIINYDIYVINMYFYLFLKLYCTCTVVYYYSFKSKITYLNVQHH